MQIQIDDSEGRYFRNAAVYPFADPESGTVFYPGVLTKAKPTEWLKSMPMIVEQESEQEEAPKKVRGK